MNLQMFSFGWSLKAHLWTTTVEMSCAKPGPKRVYTMECGFEGSSSQEQWRFGERKTEQTPQTGATWVQLYPPMGLPWLTLQPHLEADNLPCLFTGHLITKASPIRRSESKYFNSIQVHNSSLYSPYCGGGALSCLSTPLWSYTRCPSPYSHWWFLHRDVSGQNRTCTCFSYGCENTWMVHSLQQTR